MFGIPDSDFTSFPGDGCLSGLKQHPFWGLEAEITFGEGRFDYRPIDPEVDRRLGLLYSKDYDMYQSIKWPEEIKPIFDYQRLQINSEDSPEEVRHKLFSYNSKATFVIRQLAKEFEADAHIPEAWKLILNENLKRLRDNCFYKEEAAIAYLLSCIRGEILKEDYRKRGIDFQLSCSFDKNMYYCRNARGCNRIYSILEVDILAAVYDLMNFLLCSYVHKDKKESSFMLLTWDDKSLMNLPGIKGVFECDCTREEQKEKEFEEYLIQRGMPRINFEHRKPIRKPYKKLLREILTQLYLCFSDFYSVVMGVNQEDESVLEKYSELEIMKRIFKIVSKLENYAMNFH